MAAELARVGDVEQIDDEVRDHGIAGEMKLAHVFELRCGAVPVIAFNREKTRRAVGSNAGQ